MTVESPIILAVDTTDLDQAESLIRETAPFIGIYKFGLEFYLRHGLETLRTLKDRYGFRLFLDLKLHDIPNTVAKASQSLAELDPFILTVHASGGSEMITAACEARPGRMIAAVTILTSLNQKALDSLGFNSELQLMVESLAEVAVESGAKALVTSPFEVKALKRKFPAITMITPGIRSESEPQGDQVRVMTAREAVDNGSDLLVIGRPITMASSPAEAARLILQSLE
jgi:orotidine-5'-phosphate decarboxylase